MNVRFQNALALVCRELDRRRAAGYTETRASAAALTRLRDARSRPPPPPGPVRAPTEAAAVPAPPPAPVHLPPPAPEPIPMAAKPKPPAPGGADDDSLSLFGNDELPGFAPPPSPRAAASSSAAKPLSATAPPVGSFQPTSDPGASKSERLEQMKTIVLPCVKCPHLAASRTQVVFGVGNPDAEVMFIGEAPGADEDASGEPFVGRAGQLLTKIIQTMGYVREDVFISNVLKCRPDTPGQQYGNRPPTPHEMETCRPYLFEQIAIVQPKAIVALGATAVRGLLDLVAPMKELRGRWHDYQGTPVMATYHPSYLLRNQAPTEKRKVWEDLLLVKERLGHNITEKDRNYFLVKG